MKKIYGIVLLLSGILFAIAPVWAQSQRYVGEDGVELYDAPNADANIVTMLSRGVALDVLEISNAGYTRVHTPDNWEGWVLNQYLVDTRPFTEAVPARNDAPQMRAGTAVIAAPSTPISAEKSIQQGAAKGEAHSRQAQLADVKKELTALHASNKLLKDQSDRDWFLTGAGVLLLGFIIGLIVPKIRWRRKSWHSY